ncbi:MAG: hypothetical protein AAFS11_00215 [Planctomycetota bacterium]
MPKRSRTNKRLVLLWSSAWALAAIGGLVAFHAVMNEPGQYGATPVRLEADRGGYNAAASVFYFAHPHCGCTTDTIPLLAKRADATDAAITVVLTGPAADSLDWELSKNAQAAARHDSLRIAHDPQGSKAQRFGALTSGHTVMYTPAGDLAFSGGLTASRGKAGPSAGLKALDAVLAGIAPEQSTAPVFGCRLFDPDARTPTQDNER